MTAAEIDEIARHGQPMPDNMRLTEILLYQSLRLLYRSYKLKIVSKEQAKSEKARIIQQFGVQNLWERTDAESAERWHKYQVVQSEAEKHGCEICRRIVRILDGREKEKGT